MARILSSLCLVLIFVKGMSILALTHLFSVPAGTLSCTGLHKFSHFFTILHENQWLNM